jgi:hypothetical protein
MAEREEKGLRIKLRIRSPELANLPWEFMYDSREGVFLSRSTNRPIVRYPEIAEAARPLSVSLPLRILGMVAAPSDLPTLDVNRERRLIEIAVQELKQKGLVEIEWVMKGTIDGLKQALRHSPQVLHFIGHGNFDPKLDEGILAFEDEDGTAQSVPASLLADILGDHFSLRLVVLNSCEGGRGAETDLFSSTAATLVRRRIPAVVGMQYEISDPAALAFARGCYTALAEGDPIDAAVSEGRKAVIVNLRNTFEWGTPVLYMRSPDGVLFRLPNASGPQVAEIFDARVPLSRRILESIKRNIEGAWLLGIASGVILCLFVLRTFFPNPNLTQYATFRIVLAALIAMTGATFAGTIRPRYRKITTGAIVLSIFVILYYITPVALVVEPPSNDAKAMFLEDPSAQLSASRLDKAFAALCVLPTEVNDAGAASTTARIKAFQQWWHFDPALPMPSATGRLTLREIDFLLGQPVCERSRFKNIYEVNFRGEPLADPRRTSTLQC